MRRRVRAVRMTLDIGLFRVVLAGMALCLSSGAWAESLTLKGHPLVGRIWDPQSGHFLTPEHASVRAAEADYLLLGEVHINPVHHRLQAGLVETFAQAAPGAIVVMEQFDLGEQAAMDQTLGKHPRDVDGLAEATGIADKGWPWPIYRPLVERVLTLGLPLRAGNLSRGDARRVMTEGLSEVIDPERRTRLGLDKPLPGSLRDDLIGRIEAAHCGHAPGAMLDGMVAAQRARDAVMADVMLESGRAVLIAGAGHVRRDYAVPYYLRARVPAARVVTVGFTEVHAGAEEPEAYVERSADGEPLFDIYWFTPRSESEDPCESFREALKKMGKPGTGSGEVGAPAQMTQDQKDGGP